MRSSEFLFWETHLRGNGHEMTQSEQMAAFRVMEEYVGAKYF